MSSPKILDFKCALITGGAGGLGYAMAEYFISLGKKVIIVGRTEEKLKEASPKLKNAPYYPLDTGKVSELKPIVEKITKEHPELDCLINNAGVQRPLDVVNMDLEKADNEIDINIRGPVHLATLLLPHLSKQKVGVIINVSSVLGFIPYSVINPVYNGTKSFIHSWSVVQRKQISLAYPNMRVVEIVPPSVGTDLHRERENPDDNKKHLGASSSLTIEEFMDDVSKGFENDQNEIGAGPAHAAIADWHEKFGSKFDKATAEFKRK
ncbi:NAD(P)-binding protein [Meira miltonrushii]|uniref:NAD(P)-binding protein n=1 Tax=Meira miltonrushii TaxID=1280837 RepID=A0A316VF45_9BASI|nr:NAD(P)-binding protein [Meira miltonrushii]PWN35934.1 NAD(P)-binding protein [Meira miltonrushii]